MTQGVVIFANNNIEIDYLKMACANSFLIKKNLGINNLTLITDPATLKWGEQSIGNEMIKHCFENVECHTRDYTIENKRLYRDTNYKSKRLSFYNFTHYDAYDLSPYDETLFIDADYLILSDSLNKCWNSHNDFMINTGVVDINSMRTPFPKYIDYFSIPLYWATVIYFKKSETAKRIFDLVKHIKNNYPYYKDLYAFNNGLFRNDYAFSVAIHMMNGFMDNGIIPHLPVPYLLFSQDVDDIYKINSHNSLTMLLEKQGITGEYILCNNTGMDLHVMNKWALVRYADDIIKVAS